MNTKNQIILIYMICIFIDFKPIDTHCQSISVERKKNYIEVRIDSIAVGDSVFLASPYCYNCNKWKQQKSRETVIRYIQVCPQYISTKADTQVIYLVGDTCASLFQDSCDKLLDKYTKSRQFCMDKLEGNRTYTYRFIVMNRKICYYKVYLEFKSNGKRVIIATNN